MSESTRTVNRLIYCAISLITYKSSLLISLCWNTAQLRNNNDMTVPLSKLSLMLQESVLLIFVTISREFVDNRL